MYPAAEYGASSLIEYATSSILSSSTMDTMTSSALLQIATIAASSASSFVASSSSTVIVSAASSTPSPQDPSDNENGECKLLGPFAVLVQAALGALALLSLVFKRWRERPQRPLKIWAFDVSKQVFGSVLLHLANLFMSMFSAGQIQAAATAEAAALTLDAETAGSYKVNPCSFYLLNLAIDTTLGIPILILILKVYTVGASYTPIARPPESIRSGHYGTPPRATWWLKQSIIYFLGLLSMKACVFVIFQLLPWIVQVGDWALRWTEGNEALQIAFVMLIFPLIMNMLQYYIIDTFIKNNNHSVDGEEVQSAIEDGNAEEDGLLGEETTANQRGDAATPSKSKTKFKARRVVSYDPDKDGDTSTPRSTSESSSKSRSRNRASTDSVAERTATGERPRV